MCRASLVIAVNSKGKVLLQHKTADTPHASNTRHLFGDAWSSKERVTSCVARDDLLVDEIFSLMLRILNSNDWEIKQFRPTVEELQFIKEGGKIFDRINVEEGIIFVTNDVKQGLFHALLHLIFDPDVDRNDKEVENIENCLWPRLSRAQKEMLSSYVPHKKRLVS